MSLYKEQLRDLVSETLKEIDLHSIHAENLILGTIAQESGFGTYIKQLGNGPALGICQMEPNTFRDIIDNYLYYKPSLLGKIIQSCKASHISPDYMVWNLRLSIIMCRIHYLRVPKPLPTDLSGYAKYYKQYYNTYLGAGTEEEYISNYKKYVL